MLSPIPGCAAVNGCVSDGICNLGERCCLQSDCTKKCVKAVVPLTRPMRPHGKYMEKNITMAGLSIQVFVVSPKQNQSENFGELVDTLFAK